MRVALSGKSRPTTPTSCTGPKWLAAIEAYVAEPPSTLAWHFPAMCNVSNATEPTIRVGCMAVLLRGKVLADQRREQLARGTPNRVGRGDDRVAQRLARGA